MNDVFECTEHIEMGLFAIEKGSRWRMCGIKHSDFPQKSMVRITIKGLEYLEENSLMRRAANMAKGIKDIIS